MSNHNQEPTRECCELCKKEVVHSDWFNDERPCSHNCHSIKPPECEHELSNVVMNHPSGVKVGDKMCLKCNEVFVSPELSWGDELIEKSFLLNVLDGIDIADEQMGNKGGGTKAIRFALQSRIGIDLAKEREQAFNSGRASMVVEVREWMEKNIANIEKLSDKNSMKECTLLVFNELLQALKNKETKE